MNKNKAFYFKQLMLPIVGTTITWNSPNRWLLNSVPSQITYFFNLGEYPVAESSFRG